MPRPPEGYWFRLYARDRVRVRVPGTVYASFRDAEKARRALNAKDATGLAYYALQVAAYRTKEQARRGTMGDAFDDETGRLPITTEVVAYTRPKPGKASKATSKPKG